MRIRAITPESPADIAPYVNIFDPRGSSEENRGFDVTRVLDSARPGIGISLPEYKLFTLDAKFRQGEWSIVKSTVGALRAPRDVWEDGEVTPVSLRIPTRSRFLTLLASDVRGLATTTAYECFTEDDGSDFSQPVKIVAAGLFSYLQGVDDPSALDEINRRGEDRQHKIDQLSNDSLNQAFHT